MTQQATNYKKVEFYEDKNRTTLLASAKKFTDYHFWQHKDKSYDVSEMESEVGRKA